MCQRVKTVLSIAAFCLISFRGSVEKKEKVVSFHGAERTLRKKKKNTTQLITLFGGK